MYTNNFRRFRLVNNVHCAHPIPSPHRLVNAYVSVKGLINSYMDTVSAVENARRELEAIYSFIAPLRRDYRGMPIEVKLIHNLPTNKREKRENIALYKVLKRCKIGSFGYYTEEFSSFSEDLDQDEFFSAERLARNGFARWTEAFFGRLTNLTILYDYTREYPHSIEQRQNDEQAEPSFVIKQKVQTLTGGFIASLAHFGHLRSLKVEACYFLPISNLHRLSNLVHLDLSGVVGDVNTVLGIDDLSPLLNLRLLELSSLSLQFFFFV